MKMFVQISRKLFNIKGYFKLSPLKKATFGFTTPFNSFILLNHDISQQFTLKLTEVIRMQLLPIIFIHLPANR